MFFHGPIRFQARFDVLVSRKMWVIGVTEIPVTVGGDERLGIGVRGMWQLR